MTIEDQAQLVLDRLGFIVRTNPEPVPVGHIFKESWTWGQKPFPYPLVVIAEATHEDNCAQADISNELTRRAPLIPESPKGRWFLYRCKAE